MPEQVLLVDDDANILRGYQRRLRKEYDLLLANGGAEGLELLREHKNVSVIVTDMQMPSMNGIEFLTQARTIAPDTVRMMLTGNADLQTAANAVNEGEVFRFLNKPCDSDRLKKAIDAGIRQYQLVHAEKVLLEKTLSGSLHILVEILGMVNPEAFSRAGRIKGYVSQIAAALKLKDAWQLETAALLSQIGCVTVPPEVLRKIESGRSISPSEQQMFQDHPGTGSQLISQIPRLERVSGMIADQLTHFTDFKPPESCTPKQRGMHLGAQILNLILAFDQRKRRGLSTRAIISEFEKDTDRFNPKLLPLLESLKADEDFTEVVEIAVKDLKKGMITAQDVYSKTGLMLVPEGYEVTTAVLARLHNYNAPGGIGVTEPIRVKFTESITALSP